MNPAVFPFQPKNPAAGDFTFAPLMPFRLTHGAISEDVVGLLDTGASTNALPYDIGLKFGLDWDMLPVRFTVGGSAGGIPAKGLPLTAHIAHLPPVTLVFAWAKSNALPVLLGQVNFFMEFDVCFFRQRGVFEVRPATP
jgi:hypothetical protein